MPDRPLFFLLPLIVLLAAMPVCAQQQPQGWPGGGDEEQAIQPEQPAPPKQIMNIDVKNGNLTVELANIAFGTAIRAVAEKAGFRVEGSGDVFNRKLNTKFANIEIERGVTRLLSLVNESNYMLHYATGGSISRLEILPTAAGGSPAPGIRQPSRPQIPPRPQPVPQPLQQPQPSPGESPSGPPRQIPLPAQPPQPATVRPRSIPRIPSSTRPVVPPSQPAQPQIFPDDDSGEEAVEEIPYITPPPRQPQIAPRR